MELYEPLDLKIGQQGYLTVSSLIVKRVPSNYDVEVFWALSHNNMTTIRKTLRK